MTTYFTSDWHIGHKNIRHLGERPFSDDVAMQNAIFDNYNAVVNDDDLVYFVGDIFWQYQLAPSILSSLKGTKILILGNHDKGFKEKGRDKYLHFYKDAGFYKVYTNVCIPGPKGRYITVNHFPYRIEGIQQRYYDYRLENQGDWLIHGHIHQNGFVRNRQINVSVEVWDYKPVSITTIGDIIRNTYIPTVYQKTRGQQERGDATY